MQMKFKAIILDFDDTLVHLDVDWLKIREDLQSLFRDLDLSKDADFHSNLAKRYYQLPSSSSLKLKVKQIVLRDEKPGVRTGFLMPHAKQVLSSLSKMPKFPEV